MDFKTRLKKELETQKCTPYMLSKGTGIKNQNIYNYLSGKAEPTISKLKAICEYLQVSADYLLDINVP